MLKEDETSEAEKMKIIDDLFQYSIIKLQALHNEKLELIKKFRAESNLAELNRIRESLKDQV